MRNCFCYLICIVLNVPKQHFQIKTWTRIWRHKMVWTLFYSKALYCLFIEGSFHRQPSVKLMCPDVVYIRVHVVFLIIDCHWHFAFKTILLKSEKACLAIGKKSKIKLYCREMLQTDRQSTANHCKNAQKQLRTDRKISVLRGHENNKVPRLIAPTGILQALYVCLHFGNL